MVPRAHQLHERFLFLICISERLLFSTFCHHVSRIQKLSSVSLSFAFFFSLQQLFLRGLPHLCDRMRRLTAKDVAKRKKEGDEPTPDFYALNRDCALPESTPVRSTATTLPSATRAAAATTSSRPAPSLADVELAILEKRHAEIMDRINLLSSTQGPRSDSSALNQASLFGQLAPASLDQQDAASLQQRFSLAYSTSSAAVLWRRFKPVLSAAAGNSSEQLQQNNNRILLVFLLRWVEMDPERQ
jgi:hypothetical protein